MIAACITLVSRIYDQAVVDNHGVREFLNDSLCPQEVRADMSQMSCDIVLL
jgi:hypothetical protein